MVFSLFKIMLTISYPTSVTLRDLFECRQKSSKHNFLSWLIEVDLFQDAYALNNGLDKVLRGMCKSLIIKALYEVSIVFRKEIFINAKKVLNLIQSLTNEKKVIKPLTAFHTLSPSSKELELMYKFLDTTNHVCKIRMQMVNYWTCPDTV